MMGNAKTARKGNLIGAAGMIIAILGTLFLHNNNVSGFVYALIFAGIAFGGILGWRTAKKVQMTNMPELVSTFNGMGGACAALISLIEFSHSTALREAINASVFGQALSVHVVSDYGF